MNREVCLQASTEDVMSLCLTTVPLVKLAIDWWCVNCWAIYGKHQDDSISRFVSRTQRSTLTAKTARKSGVCARVPRTVFNVMGCLVPLHPLVAHSPLQWGKSTRFPSAYLTQHSMWENKQHLTNLSYCCQMLLLPISLACFCENQRSNLSSSVRLMLRSRNL